MSVVAIILVLGLVAKDLVYMPGPNVIRTVAQVLCGLAVCTHVMRGGAVLPLKASWMLVFYWVILALGAIASPYPQFVSLQVASLVVTTAFLSCYFQQGGEMASSRFTLFSTWVIAAYGISIIGSLLLPMFNASAAYDVLYVGGLESTEVRFRGLYPKPSMLASASGLLAGLLLFRRRITFAGLGLAFLALVCMALTQTRTYWASFVLSGAITSWRFIPWVRMRGIWLVAGLSVVLVAIFLSSKSVHLSELDKLARADSIQNLSGRTALWDDALQAIDNRPILGYGFTMGSLGLSKNRSRSVGDEEVPRLLARETLHNGYLQCILDAGVLGLVFYCAAIVATIWRAWRDGEGERPEVLFVLLFLALANFGESVIYSGAVFDSLFFWACAVYALNQGQGGSRATSRAGVVTHSILR